MPIVHSRPTISQIEAQAVLRVLRSGQISGGPVVQRFETAVRRYLGVRDAAAVSSGTAGLHLSLVALGVGKGQDVILPTHVCTALLNAVHYVGARPVLVDVNYEDGNISVDDVKRRLSRKTGAILVPHMWGMPADLGALIRLGVPVIEDCAQAAGALYKGKPVGTWGRINVFSFYATKMLTTGEGGMVVSRDLKLMKIVRDRLSYDHRPAYEVRYNYKMTDLQAALGEVQISKLDRFIARRKSIAAVYRQALEPLTGRGAVLPVVPKEKTSSFYRFVVKVPDAQKAIRRLKARGVNAERPLFEPLHSYSRQKGFPVSDRLMKECISLPLYPSLTDAQAKVVIREFVNLFDKGRSLA